MLEAMRELALEYLRNRLGGPDKETAQQRYDRVRAADPVTLFPFLVEASNEGEEGLTRYYTLSADPDDTEVAVLVPAELKHGEGWRLPFNQPSGSQSAALGPVIKRTAGAKGKPPGPTEKIRDTTIKAFREIGGAGQPWSPFFTAVAGCWSRPKLKVGNSITTAPGGAYSAAVEKIGEKKTVLLGYKDSGDRLPGEVREYVAYLQQVLADTKYTTGATPAREGQMCPLCEANGVKVYPNTLRGAGINLANLDRDGAFTGVDPAGAWKSYAPCLACADLLYVYCRHVAGLFQTRVAGEGALCVPSLHDKAADRRVLFERLRKWTEATETSSPGLDATLTQEKRLLNHLKDEKALNSITFVFASFGQRIDDVRGVVTDVLPSRLAELARANQPFNDPESATCQYPLFPKGALNEFSYDVSLSLLYALLKRPGGKKAKRDNESRRLFDLRRDVADAVYHMIELPVGRLWDELHTTARWHWDSTVESDHATYGLLHEGWSAKNQQPFMTLAGWVRQLAKFLHYSHTIGVLPMPEPQAIYQPRSEMLKPFFGPESGIAGSGHLAKAFAFILGVLYGKLLQVQGGRGVNVRANSLTWLRRLSFGGKDLPELFIKVHNKMSEYGTHSSAAVRELFAELAEIGTQLGTNIGLSESETCYFLLLGQSLAVSILPSKESSKTGEADA
jgi:CRISPR-associated protein Csh1